MTERELFEKLHPVPKNVVWLPSNEMYWTFTEFGETDIEAMKEQNALWQGFQAGRAAGLEAGAKVAESVNNHDNPMTANDVAAAIRAMKEQRRGNSLDR